MTKIVSRFMIEFPIWMFILETISFLVGWHITVWPFIIAFFGLAGYEICLLQGIRKKLRFVFFIFLLSAVSLFLMSLIYDTSYDGPWYHAAVIKNLVGGWNPFYHPILTINDTPYHIDCQIWMSHYAKGMETVQAGIVALTGDLESGKALNMIMLMSLSGYVYTFLKGVLSQRRWSLILLTAIIVLNPVVTGQLFTYMIDWTGYTFIVIGAICLYDYLVKNDSRSIMTLCLLGFFLPTIKFNVVFWWVVLLLGVVVLIWWMYKKFSQKLFAIVGLNVMFGFLIGGFNPYITNIVHKGNPVYPLVGKDKIDIMDIVTPQAILHKNRFYQVNYSLASNPYHNDKKGEEGFHSLTISKYNVMSSPLHDPQLGGFGMFFFEALVILIILFFCVKEKGRWWKMVFVISLSLYLSLFILPTSFMARYVPYFYITPCVLLIYLLKTQKGRMMRFYTYTTTGLLSLSILINIAGVIMLVAMLQTQLNYVTKEVCSMSQKKNVYMKTASCLSYDKMERAGAKLVYDNMENNLTTRLDLLGCDIWTSMSPYEFNNETKPWLMRKISMFQVKMEKVDNLN